MNTRLLISLLCAGALAFACGPRPNADVPPVATAAPAHAEAAAAHASRRKPSGDETATIERLELDHGLAVADKPALDVTNTGEHFTEVRFPTGQSYDFAVVDSTGREVWRWSRHHLFTQGVRNKQLGAGKTMEVSETWRDGAAPGRYTAIATLKSENYPVERRVDFVVQ